MSAQTSALMSESFADAFSALEFKATPEFLKSCQSYLELLLNWNERVDLVAPAATEALIERHFCDSFLAFKLIEQSLFLAADLAIVDVGSGAGFPGLVFAFCDSKREVILVEPRGKRAVFLKEVRRHLGLNNLQICEDRFEKLAAAKPIGLCIERALGEEELFFSEAKRVLNPSGFAVQMIGPSWKESKKAGFSLYKQLSYRLPKSQAQHGLAIWQKELGA